MATYQLGSTYSQSGQIVSLMQLSALNPNTSWDWNVQLTADMASHLDVTIIPDPTPAAPTIAQLQTSLISATEDQRLTIQSAGLTYTFPDGVVGVIQTRDPTTYPDISNINGQVTAALILEAQNVTTSSMFFRDLQNITHNMTPTQMVTMGMSVSKWIGNLYQYKWSLVNQIQALTTSSAIQAFDITQGWPTS